MRAFTGRLARGLMNDFMRRHGRDAPMGYPLHYVTAPLRAEARKRGDAENIHLWAGQAHRLAPTAPAAEIVRRVVADARRAAAAAAERLEQPD